MGDGNRNATLIACAAELGAYVTAVWNEVFRAICKASTQRTSPAFDSLIGGGAGHETAVGPKAAAVPLLQPTIYLVTADCADHSPKNSNAHLPATTKRFL